MGINFFSSKDTEEKREMYSKSDNIETMNHDKADEVVKRLFESLLKNYQIVLETSMRRSDFILIVLICYITNAIK